MNNNLPSKKVIALGIVAIGVIGSVVVSKNIDNGPLAFLKTLLDRNKSELQANAQNSINVSGNPVSIGADHVDTDKDGLKDWEELLWGTDSKNPDSDGDRTPDGEEIKLKRDPTKKGPDDYLSDYSISNEAEVRGKNSGENSKEDQNFTASDVFSQQLFSKYLTLKNAGTDSDPDSAGALVESLKDQAFSTFSYRQYNKNGIIVFDASTNKDSLRVYASSLALLQLDFLKKVQGVTSSFKADGDLVSVGQVYADFAQTLYELKVPAQLGSEHLQIINGVSVSSSFFYAQAKYKEDPVPALSAIKAYQLAGKDQLDGYSKIAEYLKNNDIIFINGVEANFWNSF